MTYASWEPRYRVTTITPGKLDLFVITYLNGKRVNIDAITDYEAVLAKARAFHREHPCQIKVLPFTGDELWNLLGISPPDQPKPLDPILRQEIIERLTEIMRNSSDCDARSDALHLLTEMGVIQS